LELVPSIGRSERKTEFRGMEKKGGNESKGRGEKKRRQGPDHLWTGRHGLGTDLKYVVGRKNRT